ncbi:5'-3' exoribonuclease [Trema orientale]|uniref:5'-3' exoribonuclease n=1 Tax=Trema orientale TaxID=63057 RepID=A0A2P5CLJ6_TREOI|nr:5'-3' exoribonuclease [Trema orientale]
MTVYKKELKTLGGYLVDMIRIEAKKAGFIKMSRVERFILLVGDFEEKILKKRSELRQRKLRQLCLQAVEEEEEDYGSSSVISSTESDSCASLKGQASSKDSEVVSLENISANANISSDYSEILKNTKEIEEKVKDNVRRKSDLFKNGDVGIDKVRLGSPGYKERYYREKFSAQSPGEIESVRKKLGLSMVKAKFQKGSPFKPFDQLLSVLPPGSAHALPKAYQALMNDDSPLIDFYPTDYEIDMDGKRYSWQGVCKLPLIDEGQIISETTKLEKDLSAEESERNTETLDQLLVRSTHKLGSYILSVSTECNVGTSLSEEIGGFIQLPREYMVADTEVHKRNQEDTVLCVHYKPSDCGSHIPRLLNGVKLPEKRIRQEDIIDTPLWHEWNERKPAYRYNNTSETTHNGADSRWGSAGRGKIMRPIMNDHNSTAQNYTARRVDGQGVHPSFNSYTEKGTFHHDQGSFRRTSGSRQEWKKVEEGRSRDGSGNGSREITTPEWNRPMIRSPNRGYQPGNGSLRPSIRNSPWLQSSNTSQPDGYTSDQGRERQLQQSKDFNWQHNSSKAGYNSSMGSGQSGHRG